MMTDLVNELFAVDIGAFRFLSQTDFMLELNVCEFIGQFCWVGTFHNHFHLARTTVPRKRAHQGACTDRKRHGHAESRDLARYAVFVC